MQISGEANTTPQPPMEQAKKLIEQWKSTPKSRKKFIMTNHKKEKICTGELEWDLSKNLWIFHFEKYSIKVENGQVYKTEKGKTKIYKSFGFAKILALPIEKWGEEMPLDNEIEMDGYCYTEFKNNKSYFIIYFQINPFKIMTITFGENRENYILFFEEI